MSETWNTVYSQTSKAKSDYTIADIHQTYQTSVEVVGDIATNVQSLTPLLSNLPPLEQYHSIKKAGI